MRVATAYHQVPDTHIVAHLKTNNRQRPIWGRSSTPESWQPMARSLETALELQAHIQKRLRAAVRLKACHKCLATESVPNSNTASLPQELKEYAKKEAHNTAEVPLTQHVEKAMTNLASATVSLNQAIKSLEQTTLHQKHCQNSPKCGTGASSAAHFGAVATRGHTPANSTCICLSHVLTGIKQTLRAQPDSAVKVILRWLDQRTTLTHGRAPPTLSPRGGIIFRCVQCHGARTQHGARRIQNSSRSSRGRSWGKQPHARLGCGKVASLHRCTTHPEQLKCVSV